ncbi:MAG: toprim domain-containing protein [Geobacteraceae bacterium]|nr:toprim domain-containing protein [Geobacteraceae bacterium]
MEIKELVQRLNDQVEEIAAHLLPAGRREGREWIVGNTNGDPGRSLKICLDGSKRGRWADFAAGASGDLLDLWSMVAGISLSEAIFEAKNFLGIHEPRFEKLQAAREFRKPSAPKNCKRLQEDSAVVRYLSDERKLTLESLAAYKVAEASDVGPWAGWKKQEPAQGPWLVLPSLRSGELAGVKYLHLNRRDGKKFTMVEPGCEPCLFGWQAIPENSRTVAITEGELDAVTLYQYGFPAMSVPFGGGSGNKQGWIDHEFPFLQRFETIYLCLDQDAEGWKATEEIVARLGAHRCKIVELPHKDANDCLKQGVTVEEMRECFASAKSRDPGELKTPSSFRKAVVEEFYPSGGTLPGFDFPWTMRGQTVRVLRGEVSVWTGINGHGKSLILNHVALAAMAQGERVCIASFEMHPRKTIFRMIRQAIGKEIPSRHEIDTALSWFDDKLWIFDLLGTVKVERMLEVFKYAYQRYGVQQFVVDSLLKCGIPSDDYNGQKAFLDLLNDFANSTDVHVHLVAHSRKDENEFVPAGKMDVKGNGDITNLASNVWSVWRNKVKESDLAKLDAGESVKLSRAEIERKPDALLMCVKARDDRLDEGKIGLFFHKPSLQYLSKVHSLPEQYIDFEAEPANIWESPEVDDIDFDPEVINHAR